MRKGATPTVGDAEPIAASVQVAGLQDSSPNQEQDWRNRLERIADYNVAIKYGRRLHYGECDVMPKLKGDRRKAAIRAAWTNLGAQAQRPYIQRAFDEETMEAGDKSAIARFLRWSRGEPGKQKGTRAGKKGGG